MEALVGTAAPVAFDNPTFASGELTGNRDARLAGLGLGDIRQSAAFGNSQVIAGHDKWGDE
ncbi:hypothetical protein L2088_03970 [Pseudomonas protegens]|uniref:hypothetical protein n=1 Tax=Pseudomonas protegens TaxID=380021 RepID=UPI002024E55A|nr:hypothetical protein [Pseudomonas protegens]MCL9653852.1 hypothetical protein [Pseudomonas protegens]